MLLRLSILAICVSACAAMLDQDFAQWIRWKYGQARLNELERADLGKNGGGSFGGGVAPSNRRPVVFVHGLRNKAGNMWNQRKVFAASGWPPQRLLATSYGPGEIGPNEALMETMKCQYVKQVRHMLEAVIAYYQTPIDVVAYSMGSPITRKAILGGKCVDTGEELGAPLTSNIITFLSVAGANQGSYLCGIPLAGICNNNNGLACTSDFIRDINSKQFYEGRHLYSLASTTDEVTGFWTGCGKKVHEFHGYTEIVKMGLNHENTIFGTIQDQAVLVGKH